MIYKLYIPKQFKGNRVCPSMVEDTNFNHIRAELKRFAMGWTEYDGSGFWVNSEGKEFSEPVKVFEIVTDNNLTDMLELTLKYFKSWLNQESMFYVKDNIGVYI